MEADEIVSPVLAHSVRAVMSGPVDGWNAYSVDRRPDFFGLLLPDISNERRRRSLVRLFNRQYSAYDLTTMIHEEVRFPGKPIPLEGILIHWRAFTIDEYIMRFKQNAMVGAQILNEERRCAT